MQESREYTYTSIYLQFDRVQPLQVLRLSVTIQLQIWKDIWKDTERYRKECIPSITRG
jgi:hypothetical protein